MKKKIFSIAILILTSLAASAQETFIAEGINYAINKEAEGEVYVVPFDDFKYYGNVVIPATVTYKDKTYNVTAVDDCAFKSCNSLVSVQFPESLTCIGSGAFQYCNNLKQISLPAKLQTIKDFAFAHCPKITKVIIPNSVTELGTSAFNDCKKLSSVTFGSGLETINSNTFTQCTALKIVTIPATVKKIKDAAFSNSGLTTVTFAGKDTEHSDYAFSSTPWFSSHSQRTKAITNNSRYNVKRRNVVTY